MVISQNKECFTYIGDQNSNVLFQKYSIYALDLGLYNFLVRSYHT
jgi:hypothetical protein